MDYSIEQESRVLAEKILETSLSAIVDGSNIFWTLPYHILVGMPNPIRRMTSSGQSAISVDEYDPLQLIYWLRSQIVQRKDFFDIVQIVEVTSIDY